MESERSNGLTVIAAAAVFTGLMGTQPLCGGVIRVGPGAGYDFPTITQALTAATDNDEIIVADGVYNESRMIYRSKAITVRSENGPSVCVIDNLTFPIQFRIDATEATILDGFTIRNGIARLPGGTIRCKDVSPTISNCWFRSNRVEIDDGNGGAINIESGAPRIVGCFFENNEAVRVGTGNEGTGGAIYNTEGSPIITNCVFIGNSGFSGGAISNASGHMTLVGCSFHDNTAIQNGGAVDNRLQGRLTVIDCTFGDNSTGNFGGGIHDLGLPGFLDGPGLISDCTFVRNIASDGGACVVSHATIQKCDFFDNIAMAWGGALVCRGTRPVTVVESYFVANRSTGGGGAIWRFGLSGTETIINCIFAGNSAGNGGVIASRDLLNSINSIFAGNAAGLDSSSSFSGFRGAIWGEEVSLSNCTVVDNLARQGIGGIEAIDLTLRNSIMWGNSPDQVSVTSQADAQHSCIQDMDPNDGMIFPGTGNVDDDPRFMAGPTGAWTVNAVYDPATARTTFVDTITNLVADTLVGTFLNPDMSQPLQTLIVANTATTIDVLGNFAAMGAVGTNYEVHDYRLSSDSPCIDAGDNTAVPVDANDLDRDGDTSEPIPVDLAGNLRFTDDTNVPDTGNPLNNGPIVDMGAYERPGPYLMHIAGGIGAMGDPAAFISPISADQPVVSLPVQISEDVQLNGYTLLTTGGVSPTSATLNPAGAAGAYTLDFNAPIPQRYWTAVKLAVENATGIVSELCLHAAHLPCDNNGDGEVGLADVSAYVVELNGPARPMLVDINNDGQVGQADVSAWVNNFNGQGLPAANGSFLPPKPACP